MHSTDEALVAAYIDDDDQDAFRELVERHQDQVFGYLMGMVRDRTVANDLFQETFLRVIQAMKRNRGSYVRRGRWLSWVMTIARNAALDHLRKRKKWTDVDTGDGAYWDRLPDDDRPIDGKVDLDQRVELLEMCIGRLPPEQREVVMLRHETDLTFREIAELTEVSINTALGRMRYALINLRKMMKVELTDDAERISTA
ncbi:MAG: sigma-70 family RNA polymerase sigma factor [Rhodothermales bacterium]